MKKVRIGTGAAFSGDIIDPPLEIAEKGDVGYIACDHLAELTLAIQQKQRKRDPSRGFAPDIPRFAKAVLPVCAAKGIKWIDNGGGANPEGAGERVVEIARELGIRNLKVAVIVGDDILSRLDELRAKNVSFQNLDTGEDFDSIRDRVVAANIYTGAWSIVDALRQGADVVITGRCADACLWLAPMIYELGWKEDDWDLLGRGIIAGHLVECSGQVCGGNFSGWKDTPEPWRMGYPIAEVYENGDAIITKVPGSGGMITLATCTEQLLYEMHDPANFMSPDVIADITSARLEEVGKDQVKLRGVSGKPKPETLKVCIGYTDGFIGEGYLSYAWPDALEKAKRADQMIRERFKMKNLQADEIRTDFIGFNSMYGSISPEPREPLNEVRLRIAARTGTREEALRVGEEMGPLWVNGPAGATGILAPPPPREILAFWPALVPAEEVPTKVIMKVIE